MEVSLFIELKSFSPSAYWPLKKCTDLQQEFGLSIGEVISLGVDGIAERLDGMGVKRADRIAGDQFNALREVRLDHPRLRIPEIEPPNCLRNPQIPLRDEPRRFRIDLISAYGKHRMTCRDGRGLAVERSGATSFGHVRRSRALVAAFRRAPSVGRIGPNFGLRHMSEPKMARIAFGQLKKEGYARSTISMAGYSFALLLREVLGEDHDHRGWWQAFLAARENYPPKALSFEEVLRVEHLLENDGLRLLMLAPERIAHRADESHIGRKDTTARLAYAVALSLKLNHPGLTEMAIARFDLKKHIVNEGSKTFVLVVNKGMSSGEEISKETAGLIKRLLEDRKAKGLDHALLSPPRQELFDNGERREKPEAGFRQVTAVTQGLYSEIQLTAGLVITLREIKDLLVTVLLRQGVSAFFVAKRAGYMEERSLRLRFQHLFKAGLPQERLGRPASDHG